MEYVHGEVIGFMSYKIKGVSWKVALATGSNTMLDHHELVEGILRAKEEGGDTINTSA